MLQGTRYYIATKINKMEGLYDELSRGLQALGYVNTYDWTKNTVERPFQEHKDQSAPTATKMVEAAKAADLFIILWADGGTGFLIETGIALGDATTALGKPLPGKFAKRLFVVGASAKEKSIFFVLEPFTFVDDIKTLLEHVGPAKPFIDDDPAPP